MQGKINTLGMQKLQSKRELTHHDAAVADECGRRQRLGEGISDHFMCAQRDEVDKTSLDEFVHEITADVNVTTNFSAHWDFHSLQHRPDCANRFQLRFVANNQNL